MSVPPEPERYLDTHVHFWDPARFDYPWLAAEPALNRPFLAGDLRDAGAAPDGVVLVEADRLADEALAEAGWLSSTGLPDLPVAGVVGHVPLEERAERAERLALLRSVPRVVGVRRLLQDEREDFVSDPGFVAGVELLAGSGTVFDVCIRHHQLAAATELVRTVPGVTFVLDHLGKPEISPTGFRAWAPRLRELARLPNARCKLSGLATEADADHRRPADLLPFLREALDAFGPARCMFGSDWPVLTLAMSYGRWLDVVREACSDLDPQDRARVMSGTAREVYRLEPEPAPR
jgi:L-fuconolactonase